MLVHHLILLTCPEATVHEAEDGLVAKMIFDKNKFDGVITDFQMPEANGSELLHHIRGSENKDVPVVLLTGTPFFAVPCVTLFDASFTKNEPRPAVEKLVDIIKKRKLDY